MCILQVFGVNQSEKPAQNIHRCLQFKVMDLLRSTTGLSRTYKIEDALPKLGDDDLVMITPLSGVLKFSKTGSRILVSGTLETNLELPCTRCLNALTVPISLEIEEIFAPTIDIVSGLKVDLDQELDIDEATLIDEQHVIDLNEVIRQSLYLAQPTQVTCVSLQQPACAEYVTFSNDQESDDDLIDDRWAELLAKRDQFS